MSSFMRHQKERTKWNDIKKVLDERFDGNPFYIQEAEKAVNERNTKIQKHKKISNIFSSIRVLDEGMMDSKTTHLDFSNKNISIMYPLENTALLAYTLDNLSYRKLFPSSISTVFNKGLNEDKRKSKDKDYLHNLNQIMNFLKSFNGRYNLTVNKIQKDVNNGILQFETSQTDPTFGICRQYMSIVMDKSKKFSIGNLNKNALDIAKDYRSLFNYFSLFGFSDVFSRCTCRNYLAKFNRKRGMQNYMCSHLFYSMSLFPYYAMYVL